MRGKLTNFGRLAGAMVIAAAVATDIALPVVAMDGAIPDTSASDAAPTLSPADAGTPTAPANDIDDRRVTAQIRGALAGDKSLSAPARNVSIATNQQAVVLRGSVSSADKDRIETLASQFAGTRQVVSQLLIKNP
jgi:osmotically-inducible protein OsmY